ncbi:MAG: hypothetical protein ACKVTZ_03370 [Bacteroidia bacterium]
MKPIFSLTCLFLSACIPKTLHEYPERCEFYPNDTNRVYGITSGKRYDFFDSLMVGIYETKGEEDAFDCYAKLNVYTLHKNLYGQLRLQQDGVNKYLAGKLERDDGMLCRNVSTPISFGYTGVYVFPQQKELKITMEYTFSPKQYAYVSLVHLSATEGVSLMNINQSGACFSSKYPTFLDK